MVTSHIKLFSLALRGDEEIVCHHCVNLASVFYRYCVLKFLGCGPLVLLPIPLQLIIYSSSRSRVVSSLLFISLPHNSEFLRATMRIAFPNTGKGFSPLVEREEMDSDGIPCPPIWLLLLFS